MKVLKKRVRSYFKMMVVYKMVRLCKKKKNLMATEIMETIRGSTTTTSTSRIWRIWIRWMKNRGC